MGALRVRLLDIHPRPALIFSYFSHATTSAKKRCRVVGKLGRSGQDIWPMAPPEPRLNRRWWFRRRKVCSSAKSPAAEPTVVGRQIDHSNLMSPVTDLSLCLRLSQPCEQPFGEPTFHPGCRHVISLSHLRGCPRLTYCLHLKLVIEEKGMENKEFRPFSVTGANHN
ncbi:hypothetical protein VTK73DRAFT_7730 [Phialemonium thermophilum]|uniref:Uncharacterized protein n=1 Tax=Phialemonium thermophilum TaxID=223376 RepID=A0ABR3WDN6_9PEZI